MQTFMTRKSFHKTMADLDPKRLVNQFEEAMQIASVLAGISEGYQHHPAVKIWRGYEHALIVYIHSTLAERVNRFGDRYNRTRPGAVDPWVRMDRLQQALGKLPPYEHPPWWNDLDVYRSHRSNLLRKDWNYYRNHWKEELSPDWPYFWPVTDSSRPEGYYLYVSKPDASRLESGERVWPEHIDRERVVFG